MKNRAAQPRICDPEWVEMAGLSATDHPDPAGEAHGKEITSLG
jgi:hypothetical protein